MSRRTATLIGFTAVLMWAFLALFSSASGTVPPFQLAAMSFLIGGLLGAVTWPFRPLAFATLKHQDWRLWALGIASLFGYHFIYFTAIRNAPPVEVSLIAYLWPLFLVVFSAFLPGEKLRLHHILGVALGMAGAVLVITRGQGLGLSEGLKLGHVLAFPARSSGPAIPCWPGALARFQPTWFRDFALPRRCCHCAPTSSLNKQSGRRARLNGRQLPVLACCRWELRFTPGTSD